MKFHEKLGVKENLFDEIINIVSNYEHVEKVLVFGSRARGEY
ncbi:MAG: nucleotidyltransferase domain-containing protein, partial [Clostridiaceae bacterium]|nr:nucleotidyltransferase domain-containing protein [Clostridiaceae bacterium]